MNADRRRARLLGALLVIMAVVTTGQTAWYSYEQQKCNEAFAKNLAQRFEWAAEDREALQDFWLSVYRHPHARQQNFRLFREWVETFQRNDRKRDRMSLPDLADCE